MLTFTRADDNTPLEIDPADIRAVRLRGPERHALNGMKVYRTELLVGDHWQCIATPHADVLEQIARATATSMA